MKLKAKLHDVTRILDGDGDRYLRLTLDVKEIPPGIDRLPEGDLSLTLEKWHGKRSMTANAYYWVLVSKIAAAMYAPQPFIHNWLLNQYGQPEIVGGDITYKMLPDNQEAGTSAMLSPECHLRDTGDVIDGPDGEPYRLWMVLRGSSTYNTKEMATLIDGAISEAQDIGIETLPPDELERMLKLYEEHTATK